ncbi:hypothetical protein Droror1_Dr00015337 [Drosera rotundifolia]
MEVRTGRIGCTCHIYELLYKESTTRVLAQVIMKKPGFKLLNINMQKDGAWPPTKSSNLVEHVFEVAAKSSYLVKGHGGINDLVNSAVVVSTSFGNSLP